MTTTIYLNEAFATVIRSVSTPSASKKVSEDVFNLESKYLSRDEAVAKVVGFYPGAVIKEGS